MVLGVAFAAAAGTGLGHAEDAAEGVPDAGTLIKEMSEALGSRSYQGIFIYTRNSRVETIEITRVAGDSGHGERLRALSGPPWEVVRDGERILGVLPSGAEEEKRIKRLPVVTGNAFRRGMPRLSESFKEHYTARILGEDRVAARDAWVVAIEPEDRFRFSHRFWVDQHTKLVLQAQLRDGDRVLERLVFTEFEVDGDLTAADLEPKLSGTEMVWERSVMARDARDDGETEESEGHWQVVEPPAGFQLAVHHRRGTTGSDDQGPEAVRGAMEHMLFSDGIAHVSIYIGQPRETPPRRMRVGALHAYHGPLQGHNVTIVGDVPGETVEHFASQLRPARQ